MVMVTWRVTSFLPFWLPEVCEHNGYYDITDGLDTHNGKYHQPFTIGYKHYGMFINST